ncbi:MAG: restriction endonuclease [Candidatus Stahlbacteria bacterium]|nr:restriction endonuclease [Candidatus Stahlbacteria bacterium]
MENALYCGDNLEVLEKIEKESVDLIYIDPPFFSNRQYEVIWHDEAEIRSFEDRWEGGIENYIAWMKPRVQLMDKVLKPTGSFYLHCDWHANAYLRIMMDKIFERNNFRNEIIWYYRRWTNVSMNFQRMHDVIFWYSKTDDYTFNKLFQPFSDKTIHRKISRDGITNLAKTRDLEKGIVMHDVWDIPYVHSQSKERQGYPTQKPEALLERIITASSKEGDVVLDAFCGCGTAMAVAHRLKRKWIGIDISPTAIKLVEKRLKKMGVVKDEHYKSIGLPTTEKELKKLKPFEFQNWVMDEMDARISKCKVGDMGIDGYLTKTLYHEKAGIQVKQSDNVGRNVIDNFETALKREKYRQGYIVSFSFTKGAYEEVARLRNAAELEIKLITAQELLDKRKAKG